MCSMDISKAAPQEIVEALEKQGLTRTEIALRLGVTDSMVSRWANGHRNMRQASRLLATYAFRAQR